MKRLLIVLVAMTGCIRSEHRDARDKYNEGAQALAKGDHEAAEKLLLDARSAAGVDPELRFRAAYDLGIAYAAHADKIKHAQEPDIAKALELTQNAASWFSDAARLRKDDPDTQANLAIMRARVQSLTDELRKAEGKLEARLDSIIHDQRGVLDDARAAWFAIKQAGGSDPLAQQGVLGHLADRERGVVAEAGTIVDLASDEIDGIAKKPDDKRTPEEKDRMIQLKALDIYLVESRTKISEARRKLQDLAAEDGVSRAEAALVALKRGRDQLLDPITVMQGVAQDQVELISDTVYGGGETQVLGAESAPLPGWLQPAMLAERQAVLHDRIEDVKLRLRGATVPPDSSTKPDPKRDKLIARVVAALPSVVEAIAAMDRARQELVDSKLKPALEQERVAYVALARAIEQFSDLKQTIELAYGEQQRTVKLLSPDSAKQLPAAERAKETREALARNLDRVTRLKELIADQVAELAQQAPPAPAAGSGSAAPTDEAKKQQAEAAKQQLVRAEELRGQAAAALAELDKALATTTPKDPKKAAVDPMVPAKDAEAKLAELRKLFFSVIEHLEQLIRDQGDTRDQTSAIAGLDDIARAPKLPGIVTREEEHAGMAKAITDALAAQADAAGKQPPQPGAPDAKTFSAAAEEVRLANGEISDARGTLVKARDATKSSESLKPSLQSQAKAIEHLENALKLLQPPKKQQQKKQDQKPEQKPEPQPQAGAGQRARDNDAAQQKKRHERDSASDPVEKDW